MRAFIPNPDFATEQLTEPDTQDGLRDAAEEIKRHADPMVRSIGAPWMRSDREAIAVVEQDGAVYVANTDHGGHLMEWGSRNNPPYAPLRRAARAAGVEVVETDF